MSRPDDATARSRFLSWVLRHAPHEVGVQVDEAGWAEVAEVLAACHARGLPLDRMGLAELVASSDKQRFALSPDGRRIRAVQGHSIPVRLDHPEREPPPCLYHGTVERFLAEIWAQGLVKGQRHHVHLSADPRTAATVGRRRGRPVVLEVAAHAMWTEGHRFWLSPNGVWLTDEVPARYLRRLP
ncbi:RNA 2'-phosphotransferase [Paraliomyxa miuraensis]|uniref:RNA 2'-phosphotransferase n=1 Tax=Paraliomyxa miuraensis TaxID=376150 RepID=UPI002258AF7F|nr:RNA 2'-phosphotransferase [Paraliomyxa miuraensis]MCX4243302.1 RNA 2'-phosphotransferase [Paraliomyxa miuraensis]